MDGRNRAAGATARSADPEDHDAGSERSRAFPQAVENPKKVFRPLVRKYQFDALLLVGDPSEYSRCWIIS